MSFGQSISNVFRNYAVFRGVASRSEFWWWNLFYSLVFIGLYLVGSIVAVASGDPTSFAFFGVLIWLFILGTAIPTIAVTVRRLHDTGRSGAFYFMTFIPFVGSFILLALCVPPSALGLNPYKEFPADAPLEPATKEVPAKAEPEISFCFQCGARQSGQNYCSKCGTKLK